MTKGAFICALSKISMNIFGREYSLAYDLLYSDKDYKKEVDFIEKIFKKYSLEPKAILELGCGTAGHAIILSKLGYRITAIDRSMRMLRIAKEKAREKKVSIEFIKGDITDCKLEKRFDAVIAMFSVMGYQTTNSLLSSSFKTAHNHLVPGGVFIFDCWYGPAVLNERPVLKIKEIELGNGKKIIRFTKPDLDILNHTVNVQFKLTRLKKGRIVSETFESHLMRYFFSQEIKYFLEVAGFKKVEFCPFLKLGKPLTERSWNMQVVAVA